MGKSLIQVSNTSTQAVAPAVNSPSFVSLGNVIRRYGKNIMLNGNALEQIGDGYYEIEGTITIAPTAVGVVTAALFENGEMMPGSLVSGSVSTAENPVTLPLLATSRIVCCNSSAITVGVISGTGNVLNVSLRDVKS